MNISKWYQLIKPNFRFYKDGFFEFPYLANTPELFIESTIKSPGSKHDTEEQVVYRNNPFIEGEMRYRKIDEGLWLTITNLDFKYDTVIKSNYAKGMPSEHYSITFTVFDSEVKLQNRFIDKVPFQNKFWGFQKAWNRCRCLLLQRIKMPILYLLFKSELDRKKCTLRRIRP